MRMLQSIYAGFDKLSHVAVWAGGAALLAMAVMVTVDVFLRKFFLVTPAGAPEISGYLFAVATSWAYSRTLMRRANIRIDTLYTHLPQKVTAILDVVGVLLLLCCMSVVTYYAAGVLRLSWTGGSRAVSTLNTPLWIPQAFWVAGLLMFVSTLLFLSIYSLVALFRRNWDLVNRVIGIPSVSEAIEEETHIAA